MVDAREFRTDNVRGVVSIRANSTRDVKNVVSHDTFIATHTQASVTQRKGQGLRERAQETKKVYIKCN